MIAQEQKPIEEILGYLDGKRKIVAVGCGGCATFYHTGDKKAVKEMAERLRKEGKEVTEVILPLGVSACEIDMSSKFLEKNRKAIEDADAVLVMSCGDGVQVVCEYIDNKIGVTKPVVPANDALGLVGGGPTKFKETCQSCGQCELGKTAGICPLTACGKGLMNGPCGGVREDGKCEVDPEKDCAWVKIYERMEKMGELDKFTEMRDPHAWSKAKRPRLFTIEEPVKPVRAILGSLPSYLTLFGGPEYEEE